MNIVLSCQSKNINCSKQKIMKKQILTAAAIITVSLFSATANSQDFKNTVAYSENKNIPNFDVIAASPATAGKAVAITSSKVTSRFSKSFPKAIAPVWYQLEQNFLVKFSVNNQSGMAVMDANGKLLYNSVELKENNLPQEIKDLLAESYADFTVKKVMEARCHIKNKTAWILTLESAKRIAVIRIIDGEVEELKMLERADG